MSSSEESKELVRQFTEALNRQDWGFAINDLMADDATFTVVGHEYAPAGTYDRTVLRTTMEGVGALFAEGPHIVIDCVIADGQRVAVEAHANGRFHNGTPYENTYVVVYEIAGDRIIAVREYPDTLRATNLFAAAQSPSS